MMSGQLERVVSGGETKRKKEQEESGPLKEGKGRFATSTTHTASSTMTAHRWGRA